MLKHSEGALTDDPIGDATGSLLHKIYILLIKHNYGIKMGNGKSTECHHNLVRVYREVFGI